jgi:Flp pilus assembly protein TadG
MRMGFSCVAGQTRENKAEKRAAGESLLVGRIRPAMRSLRLRLAREERGSALVEFAMSVMLLMFLLFGVFQGMLAMYIYHYTAWAAQQGARFAIVRGYTWSSLGSTNSCGTSAPPNFAMVYDCTATTTDIQNFVQSLGAINPKSLTINTTSSYVWPGLTPDGTTAGCTQPNSKGCLVKVTANYKFNFVPYLPFTGLTMSATSEKVIQQ